MARPPADAALLNPELIVSTALRLIDADGIDSLSMRKLATELGVTPRSLYHYVPTKDVLLREIYLHVMNKLHLPEGELADWRQVLRGLARAFRGLCHTHRSVMPYFLAGNEPCTRDTAIMEKVFGALRSAGLPDQQVVVVSQALVAFLAGYILAELNGVFSPQHHGLRMEIAAAAPDQYPTIRQIPAPPPGEEENFELALELLVGVIEARLA